jgi:MinD superfamily P-loop ATPase
LDVPGLLAVNKADLNIQTTEEIEAAAVKHGIVPVGRIPYDREVTHSQIARKTVVEGSDDPAAQAIRAMWADVKRHLQRVAASEAGGLVQIQL